MTAPDLVPVLRDVSALAAAAAASAMRDGFAPAAEADAIMERLTGVGMDRDRRSALGADRAAAVGLAKSVQILASMLAAREGAVIPIGGILDDLQAPAETPGNRVRERACMSCGRRFCSTWSGHRLCDKCLLGPSEPV